jgi:uncharacterized protein YerC
MSHVSRRQLKRKVLGKVRNTFLELVAFPRDKKNAHLFLSDVLTQTERTMIAKRLAVIVMFCRGYSGYKIRKALKVSPSTTTRLSAALHKGAFPYLEKLFRYKRTKKWEREAEDFWDTLYKVLLMGMPPRCGRGRWKFLFENKE